MVLLSEHEEVILTFQTQSQLVDFLAVKDVSAEACFQTTLPTNDGTRIALVGKVISNLAIVSEPFQLFRNSEEDKVLYPEDSGLVLELYGTASRCAGSRVTITHSNALSKFMDIWISREVHDFDGLKEFFDSLETEERLDAIQVMSRLLDPHQQILWALKFYK